MEFQGRQILASDFLSFFESYENSFINNIKSIKPTLQNNEIELYRTIIKSLLLKDFNEEKFTKVFNELEIKNFSVEVLSYGLLKLNIDFSNYLMQNNYNAQNNAFLNNAFQELLNIVSSKIQETQAPKPQPATNNTNIETIKIPTMSSGSGFALRENLVDSLSKIHNSNTPIEFLNLYKGVPIRSEGYILGIEEGENIIVRADTMQILAMQEEKSAFIIANDYIDKNISANIVLPNPLAKMVTLNNFKVQKFMHALKRKYPRVHPNKFTQVLLTNNEGNDVKGKLFDISEGGMGVLSTTNPGFKNGENINAKFSLVMPESLETIELDLNFKLVVLIEYQGAYRYSLEILPEQKNMDIIAEFSRRRVQETLKELQDMLKNYGK